MLNQSIDPVNLKVCKFKSNRILLLYFVQHYVDYCVMVLILKCPTLKHSLLLSIFSVILQTSYRL